MNEKPDTEIVQSFRRRLATLEQAHEETVSRRRIGLMTFAGLTLAMILVGPSIAVAVDIPHTFADGDVVSAARFNENFEVLADAIAAKTIRTDQMLHISPADGCEGLQDAIASLDGVSIAGTATVTISLAEGDYFCTAPIEMTHPDGERLRIEGAGLAADTVLTFLGYGVRSRFGQALGELANLTLRGSDAGVGIEARAASALNLSQVIVERFETGVLARGGSSISGDAVTASENISHGFSSFRSASIRISDAAAESNGDNGFWAFENGSLTLLGSSRSQSNQGEGYAATDGGTIAADNPEADANGRNGFVSSANSTLVAINPVATNNGDYGFAVIRGGFLRRSGGVSASGNGLSATNQPPNSPNPMHGAVIND